MDNQNDLFAKNQCLIYLKNLMSFFYLFILKYFLNNQKKISKKIYFHNIFKNLIIFIKILYKITASRFCKL